MLAVGSASASAVIVRLPGKTLSYQQVPGAPAQRQIHAQVKPSGSGNSPVEYHGGPVMPSNTNYPLYWDPAGGPEYPAGYESGLDRYFEDLAHDSGGVQNTDSVLIQYSDKAGEFANYDSHFGGAQIDTEPYPANGCSAAPICLTDEQLRAEIVKYVEAHKLPMDLEHEYFLLTPPGVESCFEASGHECSDGAKHAAYCAYHGYIEVAKAVIVYANDPYVDGLNCDYGEEHPNDNPSDATIGGGLAHEHSESVTDPELNAWYDSKGEEVADKCRTFKVATEYGEPLGKSPDGSNYNQVIDGDLYYYQQMWSNEAGGCEQRSAQLPTVKRVTPKSGPATGETLVTITGTNFAAPATVEFGATPATEVNVDSSTSITAVSPAGTAGTIDVTVATSAGTSAVNKKDHFKYKASKKKR
ncbi:MAG: IPT/TIG domain-containing protein, partial [Solirubrobacteraceae bacterium]